MTEMSTADRPPPSLSGKRNRDLGLRALGFVASAYVRNLARFSRARECLPVETGEFTVTVRNREVVARDENVVCLTLMTPDGSDLPQWRAGAHVDVVLPSGMMRTYSLCGDYRDRSRYRIAVRRIPDGQGGSIEMHDAIAIGDTLTLRGPRNAFPFIAPGFGSAARHVRFIAGGIGITPILPMIVAADRAGVDWTMRYVGRDLQSLPFLDELAPYGDRVSVRTDAEHGVPTAAELLADVPEAVTVYCCGPTALMDAIAEAVCNWPDAELHFERFSPPPVVDGKPFRIELARTGEVVDVPADRTALDTILERRPATAYSCRQGFCGTCKVSVLSGVPEHREQFLTDAEHDRGEMLICVSRCAGDTLTLDL